jgi:hypothetical protein
LGFLIKAIAKINQPTVKAKLNQGKERTRGAWRKTGTETRNPDISRINQASVFCDRSWGKMNPSLLDGREKLATTEVKRGITAILNNKS